MLNYHKECLPESDYYVFLRYFYIFFTMFLSIFFTAFTISSLSIGFATFLSDHPAIKKRLKSISKFFVCGICQMFWFSLFVCLLDMPVISKNPQINFVIVWQTTAFFGYVFRYGFLVILESLKWLIKKNNV